jgi:group I intron endonuclease
MIVIYLITNLLNGKGYVGQTVNMKRRWKEHRRAGNSSQYLSRAIAKYGRRNFDIQTLCSVDTQQQADNMEMVWIVALRTSEKTFGYNVQLGGAGHSRHSEETKKRISESMKTRGVAPSLEIRTLGHMANTGRVVTPETKEKMRAAKLGIPASLETRSRMSVSQRKRGPNSPEVRANKKMAAMKRGINAEHRAALTAARWTPSARKKFSDSQRGAMNPNFGKNKIALMPGAPA